MKKLNIKYLTSLTAGTTFSLVLISGLIIYLSPTDTEAAMENWNLFGLSKFIWKTQFIICFFLFLISVAAFAFQLKWDIIRQKIRSEFPGRLHNSRELWIAIAIPFLIFAFSATGIRPVLTIARMDKPVEEFSDLTKNHEMFEESDVAKGNLSQPTSPESDVNKTKTSNREIATGDMTLEIVSENFVGLTPEKILDKLSGMEIKAEGTNSTMYEISEKNNVPVNQLYKMIAEGEKMDPQIRHGKPVNARTLEETSREIGITIQDIQTIFRSNQIQSTGSMNETIGEIAEKNQLQSMELY
jgi:LysM repeat protein